MEIKSQLKRQAGRQIAAALIAAVVGLVAMFGLGAAMGKEGAAIGFLVYAGAAVVSLVFWIMGLANYAKSKGYPAALGILGLLGFIGALIILVLPDQLQEAQYAPVSPSGNPEFGPTPEVRPSSQSAKRHKW